MEVDPTPDDAAAALAGAGGPAADAAAFLGDLATAVPGIDEAMAFAEVMRQVTALDHDAIVFDTAPTGHTLRLLQFPATLQKGLDKLMSLRGAIGGALGALGPLMGAPADAQAALMGKLEELKVRMGEKEREEGRGVGAPRACARARPRLERRREKKKKTLTRTHTLSLSLPSPPPTTLHSQSVVDEVNTQFTDPDRTTFVCVCIPEFLSLYETERLVQALAGFHIDCRNVVINQVIAPGAAGNSVLLAARARMQATYLAQFEELYEDFHLVRTPLLAEEVRGVDALRAFSNFLVDPAAAAAAGAALAAPAGGSGAGAGAGSREADLEAQVAALKARVAELEAQVAAAR